MKHVTVRLHRADAGKWTASVWAGGRMQESYARKFTLSEGVTTAEVLFRTGDFPVSRVGKFVSDSDNAELVGVDKLVEFHLEKVLSALLELVEGESAHVDDHIVRPCFELSLEVSYGQP